MKRSTLAVLTPPQIGAVVVAAAAWAPAAAEPPHPADPAATVVGSQPPPILPPDAGAYLGRVDEQRLPWARLYRPDGSFVPESDFGESAVAAPAASAVSPVAAMPPGGNDARGVVRKVDPGQGKLTLRHGPIPRLDMPGMTMVFRVKDPALLEGLNPGDEVGFDIAIEGTTFFVTEISR